MVFDHGLTGLDKGEGGSVSMSRTVRGNSDFRLIAPLFPNARIAASLNWKMVQVFAMQKNL